MKLCSSTIKLLLLTIEPTKQRIKVIFMKPINKTVESFKESIFATISRLAHSKNAVNLGQGFPDFDGPEWIRELAKRSFDGQNQYAPSMGIKELRESISQYYNDFYNLNYDLNEQITVTNGATEAIFCTALALINPGDEVIVLEPFYDAYIAAIELAGGIPVPVTLYAPEFKFKIEELQNAFSSKTKMVFFNSPHNPTGKVFSSEELNSLCELIIKHDTYILSDEVYEFLTFDEAKHLPIASLKNMQERTITISSAGKTYGLTGWKIGWICSSSEISHAIRMVHQFNTFSVCTPLQYAVAKALKELKNYIPSFKKQYSDLRELLVPGLEKLGYRPISPTGTYFSLIPTPEGVNDIDYCKNLIEEKSVASIPLSPFYLKSKEGEGFVRLCFAKKKETLEKALKNLS